MARRSNGRIRHEGLPPQLPLAEVLPLGVGGCHSRSADIPLTPQGAVGPGESVDSSVTQPLGSLGSSQASAKLGTANVVLTHRLHGRVGARPGL